MRFRAVHGDEVEDIVALDIALRRSDRDWFERLPEAVEKPIAIKLDYGPFLCHGFHQDYIVRKGNDCLALERVLAIRRSLRIIVSRKRSKQKKRRRYRTVAGKGVSPRAALLCALPRISSSSSLPSSRSAC